MSQAVPSNGQRWYPSQDQLKDPSSLERSFRQLLTQHYDLQDQHNALLAKVNAGAPAGDAAGASSSGPATTKMLGLNVEPVDTTSLANGATLKFNKARGTFSFQ